MSCWCFNLWHAASKGLRSAGEAMTVTCGRSEREQTGCEPSGWQCWMPQFCQCDLQMTYVKPHFESVSLWLTAGLEVAKGFRISPSGQWMRCLCYKKNKATAMISPVSWSTPSVSRCQRRNYLQAQIENLSFAVVAGGVLNVSWS